METKWISLEDEKPKPWESVLVSRWRYSREFKAEYDGQEVAYMYRHPDGVMQLRSDYHKDSIWASHWMPLPDPPAARGEVQG